MDNTDDLHRAKPLAEAALAAMLRHGVPPNPRNYALWYAYARGTLPDLSRTLDILISNGMEFTAERNDGLIERFLGPDLSISALQHTEHLQAAVKQVIEHVETASGSARAYGRTLHDYSSQLDRGGNREDLAGVVAGLIAETQRVAARNEQLEAKLSRSSGEIEELRQDLAVVRQEAMTDALTGIANRKSFEQSLRRAASDALESGEPLSLLFIDIDHFKRFNDTYGHQIGDQVLRLVARTLTDCVKGRDTTSRYGGEEFAITLPQTRLVDAAVLAEQIRQTMMRRKIVGKASGEDYGNVTLSIGVASYVPGETLSATMERADAALYCAKRRGRNRVIAESDPDLRLAVPA
jgi:diguanylate cyclase